MFSKYVTILAFAASAIAGAIEPGIYRIANVASGTTARTYQPSSPVFVTNTFENPGPFELWDVRNSKDGSYTLRNVGLRTFAHATAGGVIVTSPEATSFNIEQAGNGEFVIKIPSKDAVWNAEPPVIPRGDIKLRGANGRPTERWVLRRLGPLQDDNSDYDERWELLQRIGRFLGRPEY